MENHIMATGNVASTGIASDSNLQDQNDKDIRTQNVKAKNLLIEELQLLLGNRVVEVELDTNHYQLAVKTALETLEQRSDGATEESNIFMTLQPDQNEYQLPSEVSIVRRAYRRGIGTSTGGGSDFDPFEASFSNIYLLQAGRTGGIATWEFFHQYQEIIERVFNSQLAFNWHPHSHIIEFIRKPRSPENVVLLVWNRKPDCVLLSDVHTKPWLRDWALAECKIMLGQGRSKFTSGLPGPTGNVTLNGSELIQEGRQEKERLLKELIDLVPSNTTWPIVIG